MSIIKIERKDGSFVTCDLDAKELSYFRYHVRFTNSEWMILKYLFSHQGEAVNRDDLIKILWDNNGQKETTRTIDVHVSSIRKKLAYIKGARIDSVYGYGYKLIMLKRF